MGLSGVQRTLKFVKYLPEFGWSPTVLTVSDEGYFAYDDTLLEEAKSASIEIIRTRTFFPIYLSKARKSRKYPSERFRKIRQFISDAIFIPDNKIGWKRIALKAAEQILKSKRIDLIFATAPPQTDFLIGAELKRKFDIPFVLDYRDPWYKFPYKFYPTPYHYWKHKYLEKKVLHEANHIIVTQRRTKEIILQNFRGLDYSDVTILPHGYDAEDFPRIKAKSSRSRLRITHSGTFYINRSPAPLLTALHRLFKENPELRLNIEICFIGTIRNEDISLVKRLGLEDNVNFTGYLSHKECVNMLLDSDILYLNLGDEYMSPGKIYEYFGTRKPILASLVDGYMSQVIKESEGAIVIPFGNVQAHYEALKKLYQQFVRKELPTIPNSFAQRFERRTLTSELAKIFQLQLDIETHSSLTIRERRS
jgi:glycosyltransferase involved in cell wall biosynthesis